MGILSQLGDTLVSTKLDFIYGFLKDMSDTGVNQTVELIKNKVGIDITNSDVINNLTDEQIDTLRKCVFDNFSDISNIHLQFRKLDVENVTNARDMYLRTMDMNRNDKVLSYFTPAYATFVTLVGMIYIFGITFFQLPVENRGFANTILGFVLGTMVSPIVGFYFGSSSSTASNLHIPRKDNIKNTDNDTDLKEKE